MEELLEGCQLVFNVRCEFTCIVESDLGENLGICRGW